MPPLGARQTPPPFRGDPKPGPLGQDSLLGGGIGHIVLFLPTWAYATRINKSLYWWDNIMPVRLRKVLSKLWIYGLVVTVLSWLIVMELGIFGYFPMQTNPDNILKIVFVFLLFAVISTNFTFISGFAKDVEERDSLSFKRDEGDYSFKITINNLLIIQRHWDQF